MVYSHDTFGMGNIRRMLAICRHLQENIQDVSILIMTGSPILHSFRIHQGIDYVKLPCLKRAETGGLGVRYLDVETEEILHLRSQIILATAHSFKPDILLVDKKPAGLCGELDPTLRYLKTHLPTRVMLVLRDILDQPEATIREWKCNGYDETLRWFYDRILVLGSPEIFDVRHEYQLEPEACGKIIYCGYVERERSQNRPAALRASLGIGEAQRLVLVTAGGGEDGYSLMKTYLDGAKQASPETAPCSLIITGPELNPQHQRCLQASAEGRPDIKILEFTDDMTGLIDAADIVVAMGGYNTVCELLTLRKRSIVVPRTVPVAEQRIRAERMSRLGLFRCLLPADLTPQLLFDTVLEELAAAEIHPQAPAFLHMGALERITNLLSAATPTPELPMASTFYAQGGRA